MNLATTGMSAGETQLQAGGRWWTDLLEKTSDFSGRQFAIFRIVFGIYLAWHFAALVPYAAELFSDTGLMGDRSLNPFAGGWPNPLFLPGSSRWVAGWLMVAAMAAGAFALGRLRRVMAVFLWFTWSCLHTANPLIANPSLGYVGMLLLLCAVVPPGEGGFAGRPQDPEWRMPAMVCVTAWVLLAAGYAFSGVLKLDSPSWVDGTALLHLLENPLARPGWVGQAMLAVPVWLMKWATWGVLALEVAFFPLACWSKSRPWAWGAMLAMHAGILLVVDFTDLSFGMMLAHWFTFQRSWLPAREPEAGRDHVLFLDGECAFCQRSARWLAAIDRRRVLRFASLQGETAEGLPTRWRAVEADNGAAVLVENRGGPDEQRWLGQDAILRSLWLAGGPASLAWSLRFVPAWMQNGVYGWVARRRRRLTREKVSCGLLPQSMASRILP